MLIFSLCNSIAISIHVDFGICLDINHKIVAACLEKVLDKNEKLFNASIFSCY